VPNAGQLWLTPYSAKRASFYSSNSALAEAAIEALHMIRRREFITLLGGAAAWPLAARAQQPVQMRRIGILLPAAADDAEYQARVTAFLQGLALLGWTIGRNVRIDTRWATANAAEIRKHAAELAALAPDVILAHGALTVVPLLQATRTVPIVFPVAADPVGAGYVDSLARPGGNATGFMTAEYSIGGKRLELLKQIAPGVTRAAVLRDSTQGDGTTQFAAIQAVAPSLRLDVNPVNTRDAGEIERAVAAFARSPNGGLIVTGGAAASLHRNLCDACGPAQAARGLLRPRLRRRRRLDLLWR
jgi:putative ABC transport system substrate-binding protein